jgi:hypothetical protein
MLENNLELEILCGSHWFSSTCAEIASSLWTWVGPTWPEPTLHFWP